MKSKRLKLGSELWLDIVVYLSSIIITIATIYPFVYVFSMSISKPWAVQSGKVLLYPIGLDLSAYKMLLSSSEIWQKYYNSIWIVVIGTTINILTTMLAAYPLSRKSFSYRKIFMIFITITMFFSGGMIPLYLQVKNLGLINSRWSVVLPVAASAWYIIISKTYFSTIPDSLEESAKIDGCSNIGILIKIFIPLSLPIIAVVALYSAVGHWNSYFSAMLYLMDSKKHPIQLYMARILISSQSDKILREVSESKGVVDSYKEHIKYAIIIITIVPIICLYPFLQKYFIKGMLVGSIKE